MTPAKTEWFENALCFEDLSKISLKGSWYDEVF